VHALPVLMDAMLQMARPGLERELAAFFAGQQQRIVEAVVREG
jgi:proteasome lid subunit RPN8/RPN11